MRYVYLKPNEVRQIQGRCGFFEGRGCQEIRKYFSGILLKNIEPGPGARLLVHYSPELDLDYANLLFEKEKQPLTIHFRFPVNPDRLRKPRDLRIYPIDSSCTRPPGPSFRRVMLEQAPSPGGVWLWSSKAAGRGQAGTYRLVCGREGLRMTELERLTPRREGPELLIYRQGQFNFNPAFIHHFGLSGTALLEMNKKDKDEQSLLVFLTHLQRGNSLASAFAKVRSRQPLRLILPDRLQK